MEEVCNYNHFNLNCTLIKLLFLKVGIPKVYKYIDNEPSFNIMILQKLGPSLEDFFNFCQRKFTLKTVLMLADQMVRMFLFNLNTLKLRF